MFDGWSWGREYGNVASVVGVALTIAGFIVTWIKQRRLRDATEAAQREAREIIQGFGERLALADFAHVSTLAQDLRQLVKHKSWDRAADRAERLRNLLGNMVLSKRLTGEEQEFLGASADDIHMVLRWIEKQQEQTNGRVGPQMMARLDDLILRLNEIDGRLKNAHFEEVSHGR